MQHAVIVSLFPETSPCQVNDQIFSAEDRQAIGGALVGKEATVYVQ